MTVKKPFHNQNEFTMTHNTVIDYIMPKLSGSAWKVLTVIIRKTVGWHKECDELSFSQIKTLTGIKTNTTVSEALKELEKMNVVKVDRPDRAGDDPARFWKSNIYSLNMDFEVEIGNGESSPIIELPPSLKNGLPPRPVNGQPLVQKVDTQKKELNKDSKRKSESLSSVLESESMFVAIAKICQYNLEVIGKDTKGMIGQTAKILGKAGLTPADLEDFEKWWYANDWRGKRGDVPKPPQIRETVGQFQAFQEKRRPTPIPVGPESKKPEMTPEELILTEFKERVRLEAPSIYDEHIASMRLAGCSGGKIQVEVNPLSKDWIERKFNRVLDPIAQELSPGGFEYVTIG